LDVILVPLFLAAQTLIPVPVAVRQQLDSSCAGWRIAPVIPEINAEIRERTPAWPANMVPGDFNGDKMTDVAVLVDCRGKVELVAFLAAAGGFSKHVLEPSQPLDPRQFLHLIRNEFEHDAIGVEYEAVGGHAWVFRANRWQSVPR
jgi:hypothetical protein